MTIKDVAKNYNKEFLSASSFQTIRINGIFNNDISRKILRKIKFKKIINEHK